jgi:hypothetical protein
VRDATGLGRPSIRDKGVELAYRTFDKLRQVSQAEIIENKRLGAALAFIREQQIARAEPRSKKAPRRRNQRDALTTRSTSRPSQTEQRKRRAQWGTAVSAPYRAT